MWVLFGEGWLVSCFVCGGGFGGFVDFVWGFFVGLLLWLVFVSFVCFLGALCLVDLEFCLVVVCGFVVMFF